MQISKNFNLAELTKSQTAIRLNISNQPDEKQLENMKHLINNLIQPLRDELGLPLVVNSCLRTKELNEAIGGSLTSQHMKGEAIDIECMGMSNKDLADTIRDNHEYDQLIYEFHGENARDGWVHVSLKKEGNRKEVLRAYKDDNGRTIYEKIN